MNREIYRHVAKTYGRSPAYLFGVFTEFVRSMITRVIVVILVADIAANLAKHQLGTARHEVFLYFYIGIGVIAITVYGELTALRAENVIYANLAKAYHSKITGKDMTFYRDNQGGYLVSLYRQYLDGMLQLVRFLRKDVLRTFISLVFPAVVLAISNWRIGLVAGAIVAVQLVYIVWASSKVNSYREASHEIYRKATAEVADEITNIVAYKSSGAEEAARGIVSRLMNKEAQTYSERYRYSAILDIPRDVLTITAIAGAFYLAVTTSSSTSQSVGEIVLTITYMFQIYRSVGDLPSIVQNYDDILTKIYPTLAYLGDEHETVRDPEKPLPLSITEGAIDINNLTFSYHGPTTKGRTIKVFDNFDLHIKGGEHIGIVGLSGAGKSTLANLIMRFDEVTGGSIELDGIDIRDVAQAELRSKVAYVPQEPLLFHRTIKENIAYFNDKATRQDIERAAKVAHAHNFIKDLPDGYDSMVGDRGVKLSGGQKQRVAIARAILKNAPIMIFDEATSALDSESEKIIQKALPQIVSKQTAIVIAHRLSTIQNMDRIAVLEKGKITQLGSHAELIKDKQGLYARLWAHQSEHGILDPSLEE